MDKDDLLVFPQGSGNHGGMTLRDYFAIRVLHSLLLKYTDWEDDVKMAYTIADAMLVERKKIDG